MNTDDLEKTNNSEMYLNRERFSQLISSEGNYIKKYIQARCWDPTQCDDVYQHTLLEAYKSRKSYYGTSEPRTWVCGIAFNILKLYNHRKYKTPETISLDIFDDSNSVYDHASLLDSTINKPSEAYDLDKLAHRLEDSIDVLPNNVKDVFIQVVLEGNTYGDTARKFGIPMGTVRSKIARARANLRQMNPDWDYLEK